MRRQAVEDLGSVIRANTERRSLEELAAQGKRHVRVVSGDKVIRLLEAMVDDAIERETWDKVREDRDRIVGETREQLGSVLRLQAEQEAQVRRYRERAEHFQSEADKWESRSAELTSRIEELRAERATHGRELAREWEDRVEELRKENEKARSVAEGAIARSLRAETHQKRAEARLANLKTTLDNTEREIHRLSERLTVEQTLREEAEREFRAESERRIEQLKEEHREALARLQGERGQRDVRREESLVAARERIDELEAERLSAYERMEEAQSAAADARQAFQRLTDRHTTLKISIGRIEAENERLSTDLGERDREIARLREEGQDRAVADLRQEIRDLREVVVARPPTDGTTVRALIERLTERESAQTAELEQRFTLQMERTIDEISRVLRHATASPIDVKVEATDVLVDRLFDQESEMKTNLGVLAVEERTTKRGITGNLARLREAQGAMETGD